MRWLMTTVFLAACGSSAHHGGHHQGPHHDGPHHAGPHHPGHTDHDHRAGMPHRFEDADQWSQVFDNPERDAWQRPDEVVAKVLSGREDLRVADIGAGTGYFALRFARALPKGSVVASDLEATMLAKVLARSHEAGLGNVSTAQATMTSPGLEGRFDVIFLCNTYHHIGDRTAYFGRLLESLTPHGKLVIVDFKPEAERGPPADHKVSPQQMDTELTAAGYRLVEGWDGLPDQFLRAYQPSP